MDARRSSRRLQSVLVGGLVGASAVIAAARRSRRLRNARVPTLGLAAFEDAPCYEETLEREKAKSGLTTATS